MLLKKGTKGADVIKLQQFLKLNADGDFGAKTEAAVKEWQTKNGLTADGVVGDKTWAKMFGSTSTTNTTTTSSKCVDPSVTYAPLTCNVTKKPNRQIKYIVVHYTAGGSSATGKALQTKNVWKPARPASADFVIDDTTILQANPDLNNYYTWACGEKKNPYSTGGTLYGKCLNNNSVNIEICSSLKSGYTAKAANHEGWYYTDAVLSNAIKLIKILMKKYNIPVSNVIRHYDVSGKLCPGIVGWNNENIYSADGTNTKVKSNSKKWEEFKSKLV